MKTRMGVLGGLLLAAGVVFLVGCQQRGSGQASGEVHVDVTGNGFEPAEVKIPAGKTITLVMTRTTDQTCAKEVEFAILNQRYPLPLNQPVTISLPASQKGVLSYQCGMHMLSGRVVVQ